MRDPLPGDSEVPSAEEEDSDEGLGQPAPVRKTNLPASHILVLFPGSNVPMTSFFSFCKLWFQTNLNLFTKCVVHWTTLYRYFSRAALRTCAMCIKFY